MPLAVFPKCFLDALCVTHTMRVEEWIDLAATLDIDGLEFYEGFTPVGDEAALVRLREHATGAAGLSIPMMCHSPDFTRPDPGERKEEVARQCRTIEATAALGGRYCRVLTGQHRPELDRERALDWVVECIRDAAACAARHGVTLILENHYKDGYWTYPEFAQDSETFLEVLDRLGDMPHFGVNYDPSNALIAGEDPIALLEAVKHRVVTMHASDRMLEGGTLADLRRIEAEPGMGYAHILKHGVIGEGLNDYDRIFSILAEVGFDGWISIEDGDDPVRGMERLRRSVTFVRGKMLEYGVG